MMGEFIAAALAGLIGFGFSKWIERRKPTPQPEVFYETTSFIPRTFESSGVLSKYDAEFNPELRRNVEGAMMYDFGRKLAEQLVEDNIVKVREDIMPTGDTRITLRLEIYHK